MGSAAIVAIALVSVLTGCGKAPEKQASNNRFVPTKAQLDAVRGEGPLRTARAASRLDFRLHYKPMQTNGMQQALGGEAQAIARYDIRAGTVSGTGASPDA